MYRASMMLALAVFAVTPTARAEDKRLQTSMSATNLNGDALDIGVRIINQTDKDLCIYRYSTNEPWDLYAPHLLTKDGTDLLSFYNDRDVPAIVNTSTIRDTVDVIWKGAERYLDRSFGSNRPFGLICSADDVATVTYKIPLYDCAELFKSHGQAKPLYERSLVTTPINELPPVPFPKQHRSCFPRRDNSN